MARVRIEHQYSPPRWAMRRNLESEIATLSALNIKGLDKPTVHAVERESFFFLARA